MPTTTNYGWTTPADTDLVKDGASAIRTLGSSVDTTTKALNPSTTLGDIEYRSSTANTNTRLGIGTTGQILTVAGGVPSWAAAPSSSPTSANNYLANAESTSSSSYTNLTTSQSVTLTTGTKVMVIVGTYMARSFNGGTSAMSYEISGATTSAASDDYMVFAAVDDQQGIVFKNQRSYVSFRTVTAGSNTFTAKFRSNGGTTTFGNRTIAVIDLGS
jgi:hypothetical protein